MVSQAQIIDSELTAKLLGRGVAVSPVVTVEPRRRKFHKAITLSMPAPRPHTQGMTNQYSTSSAPTLRLLCSISGMTTIICLHTTADLFGYEHGLGLLSNFSSKTNLFVKHYFIDFCRFVTMIVILFGLINGPSVKNN